MDRLLELLVWPVTIIIVAGILTAGLASCVNSTDRKWENYATACVQNGGQLIGGQCLR